MNLDPSNLQNSPTLVTNKADYAPTDTVVITGTNFLPKTDYTLLISSTDPPAVNFSTSITTNEKGSFVYAYQLDGNYRPNYTVQVKDSSGTVVATTTFTDTPAPSNTQLNQWETKPSGKWITGELNSTNSDYKEGETVPFELDLGTLATSGNPYTFSVCRDYQDGAHFGYIYLQPFNTSRSALPGGLISTTNDPFSGSNISSINFTEVGGQGGCAAGQRETQLSITVTSGSVNTYLLWGGKLAAPGQDGVTAGNGASSYPGGSLHMHLLSPKKDVGIQTSAIIPMSSITIHKTTIPSGGTGFSFTTTGALTPSTFSLDDGGTQTYFVPPGSYSVTENNPSPTYSLTELACGTVSGTGTSATPNLVTRTVSITIGVVSGGTVDCTYTNTKSKVTPTISTTPSSGGNIGTVLNDSASLSDGFTPTGSIIFNLFGPSDTTNCQSGAVYSQTVSVNGNGIYSTTPGFTSNAAGTYHWTASYIDDSFNNPVASGCADEPVTIVKNSPSITTNLSATTANIGDKVHDSATLTWATTDAGGTVTYTVYTDNACTQSAQSAGTVTVKNGSVPNSNNITFNSAGDYYWQAAYSGDSNNNGVTSTCTSEHLVINKNSPSISTTLSSGTINVGGQVHDSSTLSGATSNAGGTVAYTIYSDNACSLNPVDAGTKTVTSGAVPDSNSITFNNAGTYYWQAVYLGDSNNKGASSLCTSEVVTVNKLRPTISTKLSASSVEVGAAVSDSSTLSGATGTAGGTVTYNVYTNNLCTTAAQSAGTKSVTNGIVPDSDQITFNTAGDYYWQAVYSSDTNNEGATSMCTDEHLVVNKATPTLTTTASGPVIVGSNITDTAHLSGGFGTLGGSITFDVFAPGDTTCSTPLTPVPAGAKVVGANDYTSGDFTTSIVGDYHWIAHYHSLDPNNNSVDTPCGDANESSTVNRTNPTIATTLSATTANIGDKVHDSATLTGATTDAGGTVTYHAYAGANNCSGTDLFGPSGNQQPVTSGNVQNSEDISFANAGTYSFQAVYSGDAKNNAATSDCSKEQLVINKSQPSIVTNATPSVTVGQDIKDTATISKLANPDGTSKITFTLYSDNACKNQVAESQSGFITDNGSYDSSNYTTTNAGTYYWIASFPGDSNNASATTPCGDANESSATQKATPTLTTTASGPVTVGANIHDVAHLGGGFGTLTGSLTFDVFAPGDTTCSTPLTPVPAGATVSGTGDYISGPYTTTTVGDYHWIAHYHSLDPNNNSVDTPCGDANESSATQKATPTIQTVPSAGGIVGINIHDTANVTGGYNPTGGVTFKLYDVNDSTCANASVYSDTEPLTSGSSTSGDFPTVKAGTYHWIATYNGDASNNIVTSACSEEAVTISKSTPSLTTTASGPVIVGSNITDTAHLSGGFGTLGGSITFDVFAPGDTTCSTPLTPVPAGAKVVGANDYTSGDFTTSIVGDYHWIAHYHSLDPNNNSVDTPCGDANESSTVNRTNPTIVTTLSATTVNLGSTVHDSSALTDATSDAGGTVAYKVYTDNACSLNVQDAGTKTVTNGIVPDSDKINFNTAGDYYWQASYSGDAKNNAAISACTDEHLVVNPSTLTINKEADTGDGYVNGNSLGFTWTLDGGPAQQMGATVNVATMGSHTVNENSLAGYVFTGWFSADSGFSCREPEGNSLPVSLTESGQPTNITLCNKFLTPSLTISKSNNATGDKSPGDNVVYTLTVTAGATGSEVLNVHVTDLLPQGFVYHPGSWGATKNKKSLPFSVPEPNYHSLGVWSLGDLNPGDVVVLTYTADISSSQPLGLYKDVAWASGCDLRNPTCSVNGTGSVLAQGEDSSYVNGNFVGTDVNVVGQTQPGAHVDIQGEVLGASTSLPATGGNAIWIVIATLLSISGAAFVTMGLLMRKKRKVKLGILSKFIGLFILTLLVSLFLSAKGVAAGNVSARIEQPKSPTNLNNFNVTFVTLDLLGRDVNVQCYKRGPSDGGMVPFGSVQTFPNGGNTGTCAVNSSIISASGTYLFQVTATAGVDSDTSKTDSVDYNTSGPGTPTDYSKSKPSSCQYLLTFKSADDGGKTVKIEVYRSNNTSFNVDNSTRVATVGVSGPNQSLSYTDTVPDCNATWYYVIRAFDRAGNGSGIIGDSVAVNTTTTTTTTPASGAGALPVSGVTLPGGGTGGAVLGAEGKAGTGGAVLGEATPSGATLFPTGTGATGAKGLLNKLTKPRNLAIILVIIIVAGGVIYVFKKRQAE